MPYLRQNPFYQFQNPYLGQAANGLAAIMFQSQTPNAVQQSAAAENEAQAKQALAAAGLSDEKTRGIRNTNNAMAVNPDSIAEILLSGGIPKDDPFRTNPNFQPPAPMNFDGASLLDLQAPAPVEPAVMPGRTAQEKMAAAIQEAAIRKIPIDKLLETAGIAEYLRRIQGQNPDSALGLAPFAGVKSPNADTSLTTTRQDQVSARNSAEDIAKQETVNQTNIKREGMQQEGANKREGMQQANANWRTKYNKDNDPVSAGANVDVFITKAQADKLGIKPNADGQYVISGKTKVGTGQDIVPGTAGGDAVAGREKTTSSGTGTTKVKPVPAPATKTMTKQITDSLASNGIKGVDQNVINALVAEAGTAWQTSGNPTAAADQVVQRLLNGETVGGVSTKNRAWYQSGNKEAVRNPPGSASTPIQPAPAAAPKPSAATQNTMPKPNQQHIDYLRQHPEQAGQFEKKFGAGSAAQYLK